jgi:predicted PurR-regulated permease PerM
VSAFGFIGLVLGPIVLVTAGSLLAVFTRVELVDTTQPRKLDTGSRKLEAGS